MTLFGIPRILEKNHYQHLLKFDMLFVIMEKRCFTEVKCNDLFYSIIHMLHFHQKIT